MQIKTKDGQININGRVFKGTHITIRDGEIIVDGVIQDGDPLSDLNVTIHGDVERIETTAGKVTANRAGSIRTKSGDVECGDVSGDVKTMSGDIECGAVGGGVETMSGDIRHR